MKFLDDMDFKDKKVLLRAGFDVPINEEGDIQDDSRIKATLPTIRYILDKRPKQLIIISHMGEPDGKVVENLKFDKLSTRLIQLLEISVYKTKDCIVGRMPSDGIILLENLRFHKEETENDDKFAMKLASYADIYVNDAFSVCHRKHASLDAVTKFLPSCAGLLIQKELEHLDLDKMPRPIVALLGGAKLKTKIPIMQRMLLKADSVAIGGGMIFTFYRSKGHEVGHSMLDKDYLKDAQIMFNNEKLYVPEDVVVAESTENLPSVKNVLYSEIPAESMGLDIGVRSIGKIKDMLKDAKTIIWNGPLGYYEKKPFDEATITIARFIADLDCNKIIGGGDTADVIHKLELEDKFTFISSGGGAALEVLSGNKLPALVALDLNEQAFGK